MLSILGRTVVVCKLFITPIQKIEPIPFKLQSTTTKGRTDLVTHKAPNYVLYLRVKPVFLSFAENNVKPD